MKSVQLFFPSYIHLTDFSTWALRRLFLQTKWICKSAIGGSSSDIIAAASQSTHTQTQVANYLVCVCLAALRSTTIGTGS
jgi:hypothetical protein